MKTIPAGWALVGKRPGTYDDYSVIASSNGPFSLNQFHKLVFTSSPGNPPAPQEAGPAALPWAWFNQASIRGINYAGIAIREWTEHVDAINRPIAFTRYFCLPLDDVVSTPLAFSDIYDAVADIPLPWDLPDPLAGDLIELRLPPPDPKAAADTVRQIGVNRAATAATRLFEGPVSLLGGSTDLLTRLRTLDAIAALLPAGAKAWLTASSWADYGVGHSLKLTFAQRARGGDLAVDLRGDSGADHPRLGYPSPYHQAVVRLCEQETVAAVVLHLARLGRLQGCDPYEAELGLKDMALPREAVQAARDGTLRPALVRRLGEQDKLDALIDSDRVDVLTGYLARATPADLTTDTDLLARHWSADLGLAHLTHMRLWESDWTEDDLMTLAVLAQATAGYGALGELAKGLLPPQGIPARSRRFDVAGRLIVRLAEDPRWAPALAARVVSSEGLTIAVLRTLMFHTASGLGAEWIALFDEAGGPDSPWVRLSRPCRAAYLGEAEELTEADIELLHQIDPDLVVDLIRNSDQGSSRFGRVADAVLDWLQRQITSNLPPPFGSLLRELNHVEVRHQAAIDFMFYRTGERPPRSLEHSQEYRDALVAIAASTELSRVQWETFIEHVANRLFQGWSTGRAPFDAMLDTLWRLSHPPDQDQVLTPSLIRRVADEIVEHPVLLDDPSVDRWLEHLERDPRLGKLIKSARLAHLPPGAPNLEVARTVIELLGVGTDPDELVNALIHSRWRPDINGWAMLISTATGRPRNPLHLTAHLFGVKLGRALMRGDFGEVQAHDAVNLLPLALLPQLRGVSRLAHEAAANDDAIGRRTLGRYVDVLREVRAQLDEIIQEVDGADRPGFIRRLVPGSKSSEERRADGAR